MMLNLWYKKHTTSSMSIRGECNGSSNQLLSHVWYWIYSKKTHDIETLALALQQMLKHENIKYIKSSKSAKKWVPTFPNEYSFWKLESHDFWVKITNNEPCPNQVFFILV